MPLLAHILYFIKQHKGKPENAQIAYLLNHIEKLLIASEDGRNLGKLQHAILFIQFIPTITDWLTRETTPLILHMSKERRLIDPRKIPLDMRKEIKEEIAQVKPLKDSQVHVFDALHKSLIYYYKPLQWSYDYPLDETGQVRNDAIVNWQREMIAMPGDGERTYLDFVRSFSIEGKREENQSSEVMVDKLAALAKRVETLVNKATDYPHDKKQAITDYIKTKGGQVNNSFLVDLLQHGHFSEPDKLTLNEIKGLEQDWHVENGRVCLTLDYAVHAFMLSEEGKLLYAASNGSIAKADNAEKLEQALLMIRKMKSTEQTPAFLMRMHAKIELTVNESGQVVPRMTRLHVDNYAKELLSPKRLESPLPSDETKRFPTPS